jgi:hypothetical protein
MITPIGPLAPWKLKKTNAREYSFLLELNWSLSFEFNDEAIPKKQNKTKQNKKTN